MTILETVIAATLVSVAIVAAVSLSTNTQKETSYARDLSLATKHNAGALDWLKRLRAEMGWFAFVREVQEDGGSPTYCVSVMPDTSVGFAALSSSSESACSGEVIAGTSFYRVARLTLGSPPDYVDVVITTYFGGDSNRSVATETRLSNY